MNCHKYRIIRGASDVLLVFRVIRLNQEKNIIAMDRIRLKHSVNYDWLEMEIGLPENEY